MLNKLLFKLTAGLRVRLITVNDQPYLERYYVGMLFGITFYLHRFVRVDNERHVHNHPWGLSGSIVLSGWYDEERVVDLCPQLESGCILKVKRVRWFNIIWGSTFHRIMALRAGTWTLFWHGPRVVVGSSSRWVRGEKLHEPLFKGWGFLIRYGVPDSRSVCTVFEPFPPTYKLDWWVDAPIGRDSTREPL